MFLTSKGEKIFFSKYGLVSEKSLTFSEIGGGGQERDCSSLPDGRPAGPNAQKQGCKELEMIHNDAE